MKPGDIVLIPFPFSNLTTVKVRPALVISTFAYNDSQDDVILLSITSKAEQALPNGVFIDSANEEFTDTGLKKTSIVRTGHIVTLEKTLIKRLLGHIPKTLLNEVRLSLKKLIGIT